MLLPLIMSLQCLKWEIFFHKPQTLHARQPARANDLYKVIIKSRSCRSKWLIDDYWWHYYYYYYYFVVVSFYIHFRSVSVSCGKVTFMFSSIFILFIYFHNCRFLFVCSSSPHTISDTIPFWSIYFLFLVLFSSHFL